MYRNSADSDLIFTPEDIALFRESPFASWMERLTLENPEHGIKPDAGSDDPADIPVPGDNGSDSAEGMDYKDLKYPGEPQLDDLQAGGRRVESINWQLEEPLRLAKTERAMCDGADFIVNGQLAIGVLSGAANLLMRTTGESALGNYLYLPCDSPTRTTPHSTFRLCFLADILHTLQGLLPPRMMAMGAGSELVSLDTEDHIYYYQAIKRRFIAAQAAFREDSMPDPVESSHLGRWSAWANEVLRQRALSGISVKDEVIAEGALKPEQIAPSERTLIYDLDDVDVEPSYPSAVSGDSRAAPPPNLRDPAEDCSGLASTPSEGDFSRSEKAHPLDSIEPDSPTSTLFDSEETVEAPCPEVALAIPEPDLPGGEQNPAKRQSEPPYRDILGDSKKPKDPPFSNNLNTNS